MGLIPLFGLALILLTFVFLGKRVDFPQKKLVILFYSIFLTLWGIASIFILLKLHNLVFFNLMPLLLTAPLHFFFKAHLVSVFWKRILTAVGQIFIIYYLLTINKISSTFHLLYYLFFAFYILLGSFRYLIEELNIKRNQSSKFSMEFWFIVCLFFYASNCMLFWTLYEWLIITLNNKAYVSMLWVTLHNGILFIHCFIFSIALIWNRYRI